MYLQNDPSAPVVITSVMYHVGSKMKTQNDRFCHFFEHLFLKELKTLNEENGLK
jgi:predicted Zn-dependent peptidase